MCYDDEFDEQEIYTFYEWYIDHKDHDKMFSPFNQENFDKFFPHIPALYDFWKTEYKKYCRKNGLIAESIFI